MSSMVTGSLEHDQEIAEKRVLLDRLEGEYAAQELFHQTLSAELDAFHLRYSLRVGVLYAELDRINAEIARLAFERSPGDQEARQKYNDAQFRANKTADEVNRQSKNGDSTSFCPTDRLKDLYRRAAKLVHPDRAAGEEDRLLRDELMSELNRAYRAGDESAIEDIVASYEDRRDSNVLNKDNSLGKVNRAIADLMTRIAELKVAVSNLKMSDLFRLMRKTAVEEAAGRDPLSEMANHAYQEIAASRTKLASMLPQDVDLSPERPAQGPGRDSVQESHFHANPVHSDEVDYSDQGPGTQAFRPEGLIHRTERGEYVRSKSEVIVANTLLHQNLDYRYEYPIEGQITGGVRRPDFVFLREGARPVILEHLGMLQVKLYADNWRKKLAWYTANGFTLGDDLFVTEDGFDGSLDSKAIRAVCEAIKYRL